MNAGTIDSHHMGGVIPSAGAAQRVPVCGAPHFWSREAFAVQSRDHVRAGFEIGMIRKPCSLTHIYVLYRLDQHPSTPHSTEGSNARTSLSFHLSLDGKMTGLHSFTCAISASQRYRTA